MKESRNAQTVNVLLPHATKHGVRAIWQSPEGGKWRMSYLNRNKELPLVFDSPAHARIWAERLKV